MTITENDFIEKMIEIAKTGYENMTQLQCVFFTWNEFFNTEEDACRAFEVASQIFSAAYPDEAPWTKLTISGENSPAIYKKFEGSVTKRFPHLLCVIYFFRSSSIFSTLIPTPFNCGCNIRYFFNGLNLLSNRIILPLFFSNSNSNSFKPNL